MSSVSSKSSSSSLESLNENFGVLVVHARKWKLREMLENNDEQFQGIYPLATNMASVFSFVTVFSYIYNIFSTVNSFIFTFLKLYL